MSSSGTYFGYLCTYLLTWPRLEISNQLMKFEVKSIIDEFLYYLVEEATDIYIQGHFPSHLN